MIEKRPNLGLVLATLFEGKIEALSFIRQFLDYCHLIDDFVDGDIDRSDANLFRILHASRTLYSTDYYIKNAGYFYPIMCNIANAYADSVEFENAQEGWKHKVADVLRNAGNELLLLVVEKECGYEAVRKISKLVREEAHYLHHDLANRPT